jgi:CARDB
MRRFRLIAVALAATLFAPAAAAAAPSGARLLDCASALEPDARQAIFEGRMRSVRGAVRMQMRFTLQSRSRETPRWRAVPAPGFGRWLTSDANVGRYVYTKRVISLAAPASYRTIVRFRWLDAAGDRVASARSISPVCRQQDLRPNLRPLGVEAREGADAEHARYLVPLVNRGHTLAGPFDVVVSVDGTTLAPAQVPELGPGEHALVEVQGPPCSAGQMLTVDVDPTGAVDERNEADNRFSVPCPGAPA